MRFTHLAAMARKARSMSMPLLVVAISALLAFLFTIATQPDAPTSTPAAGKAHMRLLQEEHELIADYTRASREAERTAIDRSRAEMRTSVVAEATETSVAADATGAVAVLPQAKPVRPSRIVAIATPPRDVAAGPPLPLQAAVTSVPQKTEIPVIQRARSVLATVQRIPHWVGTGVRDAADWAISGPVQTIARLPERRFL